MGRKESRVASDPTLWLRVWYLAVPPPSSALISKLREGVAESCQCGSGKQPLLHRLH